MHIRCSPLYSEGRMIRAVSANRLGDGRVVFIGADGRWVEALNDAARYETAEALEAALVAAREAEAANWVVDTTVVDLSAEGMALTLRDRVRSGGPTIVYGANATTHGAP